MKLNVMTCFGPEVQGDVPHRFAVSDGVPIGTFRSMPGIENVCPTLQPDHELSCVMGLPFSYATLPIVPVTLPKNGLRSGVQPSYPRIVMSTWLPAGTWNNVVCTHALVFGSWTK